MKVLKSLEEIAAAGLSPPLRDAAREVLQNLIGAYAEVGQAYDPADDGYVIVIEGGEPDAEVEAEVGYPLREALFEGVTAEPGCFVTCTLHNNEYGISWVIADSPALDPELRARLVAECGGGVPR